MAGTASRNKQQCSFGLRSRRGIAAAVSRSMRWVRVNNPPVAGSAQSKVSSISKSDVMPNSSRTACRNCAYPSGPLSTFTFSTCVVKAFSDVSMYWLRPALHLLP